MFQALPAMSPGALSCEWIDIRSQIRVGKQLVPYMPEPTS